jgi:hypothetical protein
MFITVGNTEHYHFIAAGETEEASRKAWEDGFFAHMKQYEVTWDPEGFNHDGATPLEWYDPWTLWLLPGDCLRDGDKINPRKETA